MVSGVVVPGPRAWRAQWLKAQRLALEPLRPGARKVTQEDLAPLMGRAGLPISKRLQLVNLENGRPEISDELLAQLANYFGVPVPPDPAPPKTEAELLLESNRAVATAITAQTTAISRLVDRLESLATTAIRDGAAHALLLYSLPIVPILVGLSQ